MTISFYCVCTPILRMQYTGSRVFQEKESCSQRGLTLKGLPRPIDSRRRKGSSSGIRISDYKDVEGIRAMHTKNKSQSFCSFIFFGHKLSTHVLLVFSLSAKFFLFVFLFFSLFLFSYLYISLLLRETMTTCLECAKS